MGLSEEIRQERALCAWGDNKPELRKETEGILKAYFEKFPRGNHSPRICKKTF